MQEISEMSAGTPQGAGLLRGWRRLGRFETGLGVRLPEAYKKFWNEWKNQKPAAVHYVPKEGTFERDEATGLVRVIQNVAIPIQRIPEEHQGIWGGEGIIKGFQKRTPLKRRVPHFWVPTLKRSAVRSEILNDHFSVTVTDRTIRLILESRGFDHYLLMTPACDLRSELALKMKQKMLLDLSEGCPNWKDDPKRQAEVLEEYGKYLENYTQEEIEWYGLNWSEAIKKMSRMIELENTVVPHKLIFRSRLLEQLKEAGIDEAQGELSELKGGAT